MATIKLLKDVQDNEIIDTADNLKFWGKISWSLGNPTYIVSGRLGFYFYPGTEFAVWTDVRKTNPLMKVKVVSVGELDATRLLGRLSQRVNNSTGSDPEIFVLHGEKKKKLFPAFEFLPTQAEKKLTEGGKYPMSYCYRDGFAAEMYTNPASCHGYFIDHLRDGLRKILLAARAVDPTSNLTIQNTIPIPKTILTKAKLEDIALGCQGSENAYNNPGNIPMDARKLPVRFAGGHVHMSMNDANRKNAVNIVKGCDLIAGIAGVAIFAEFDNPIRRNYYGRAGEYRLPSHGLEYRTLSNAWLGDPRMAHLMLNLVRIGAKIGNVGLNHVFSIPEEKVQEIINYCDVEEAKKLMEKWEPLISMLLVNDGANGNPDRSKKKWLIATQEGVKALLPKYENIEANWKLTTGSWMNHSNGLADSWSYGTWGPRVKYES